MAHELKSIRAFIAIPLPDEIRRHLGSVQSGWQAAVPGKTIRWTPVEQIHLTLRFLGGIPPEAVRALEAGLRRACDGVAGFELCAAGSGCFPSVHQPRVLWVGVGGDLETLAQLQRRVRRETAAWGELDEREFRAHLTIGRVKDAPPAIAREIARRAQTRPCGELGRWRAGAVWLMRSELSPAGARHTELARCALQDRARAG